MIKKSGIEYIIIDDEWHVNVNVKLEYRTKYPKSNRTSIVHTKLWF